MHNSLIVINDSTPYRALFGRQPALLPPLEGGYHEQRSGQTHHDLSPLDQKDVARVRELSASAIIEATAQHRLERADRHNTHSALERSAYEPGQLVDIWYEPTQ